MHVYVIHIGASLGLNYDRSSVEAARICDLSIGTYWERRSNALFQAVWMSCSKQNAECLLQQCET